MEMMSSRVLCTSTGVEGTLLFLHFSLCHLTTYEVIEHVSVIEKDPMLPPFEPFFSMLSMSCALTLLLIIKVLSHVEPTLKVPHKI